VGFWVAIVIWTTLTGEPRDQMTIGHAGSLRACEDGAATQLLAEAKAIDQIKADKHLQPRLVCLYVPDADTSQDVRL
jgi:hypothetical protein